VTTPPTTPRELARLRLVAQRLAHPTSNDPAEVVRWMTALQAQDHDGVLTSVALRTTAGTREAVEAALEDGRIVRSWPMRGTLHLVAAEDLPWMLDLLTPRVLTRAAARRAQLGIDGSVIDRARRITVDLLTGGGRARRNDLMTAWREGGIDTTEQRGYHLLWYLAQTGTVCLGPVRDGEQLIVLVDEWIRHPRRPERTEALGELATRYFRSHGPATARDFARWTNLLAADVRTALALARPHLARLELDGVEYFLDPRTPELLDACRERVRGVFLLPGFDEFVLGYQDRSAALPAEFARHVVPGGNGVFRPTVVSDGQVVGTWRRTGRGARREVVATPFDVFPDGVAEAVPRVYATLP